jgi:hypothetical protein
MGLTLPTNTIKHLLFQYTGPIMTPFTIMGGRRSHIVILAHADMTYMIYLLCNFRNSSIVLLLPLKKYWLMIGLLCCPLQ